MKTRNVLALFCFPVLMLLIACQPVSGGEQPGAALPTTREEQTMLPTKSSSPTAADEHMSGLSVPTTVPSTSRLAEEAIGLAKSDKPEDHARLARQLQSEAYLDRLDSPEVVQVVEPVGLQLGHVLRAAAADAPGVIDKLVESPLYAEPGPRQAALVHASAAAREPHKGLIRFWRLQLDPEADELESTIDALFRNGSDAAILLLKEAFTSDAFDDELVFWWFRGPLLERRQDVRLLTMAEDLLRDPGTAAAQKAVLNAKRRFVLVEALFDYRPNDWYAIDDEAPRPPDRSNLTDDARRKLLAIADLAERERLIDADKRARIQSELAPVKP